MMPIYLVPVVWEGEESVEGKESYGGGRRRFKCRKEHGAASMYCEKNETNK